MSFPKQCNTLISELFSSFSNATTATPPPNAASGDANRLDEMEDVDLEDVEQQSPNKSSSSSPPPPSKPKTNTTTMYPPELRVPSTVASSGHGAQPKKATCSSSSSTSNIEPSFGAVMSLTPEQNQFFMWQQQQQQFYLWQQQQQHLVQQQQQQQQNNNTASSVALPCASISFNYKATKAPKETLQAIYKAGEYKASLPLNLLAVQSFMAGVYIGMAGHLYLAVGGGVLGAAMFPTALMAVVFTSAELFTGDALVFVAATLGGKVSINKLIRNWTVAWFGNFAGCIFWASLLALASDSIVDLHQVNLAITVAQKKALQPWSHILIKGIGANFMVCLAVWQATCAEEVAGKVLALWFPVAAFVLMGFEHTIANQFLVPMGMMLYNDASTSTMGDYGEEVTVGRLFYAQSAATLGNVIGGGLMVGAVYWYVYDSIHNTSPTNNINKNNDNSNNNSTSSATTAKWYNKRRQSMETTIHSSSAFSQFTNKT